MGVDIADQTPHGPSNSTLGSCDYVTATTIAALGLVMAAGDDGQLYVSHCQRNDPGTPVPGVGDSAFMSKDCSGLVATKGGVVLNLIGYKKYLGDRASEVLGALANKAFARV